ncbi:glycosyltransferase family 2 protein [Paenibacillus lutrae]|uniref:Glycosyltransferase n=1 Tax=Paenibacillus lutrae TaxID=2078573 RepID=A0A7X3FFD6_9BACL|nr:glycosyltransferase family 2 protein [Paenibacillus lutrae]MVO98714.1 glycosyltransferase [Paenibacillus lutrae]
MSTPVLIIVVPCYNEEEVLHETVGRLDKVLHDLIDDKLVSAHSTVLFVDDGSRDRTWALIEQYSRSHDFVTGVKLARNAGHQNALLAGLMTARQTSDITISIDADLQDDTDAIREFVVKYHEGAEVVYGIRSARVTDTWFKKTTAESFYKLMHRLGVQIKYNHADYRLLSRRALDYLAEYKEVNVFLRGIVPLLGLRTAEVMYERKERFAGESKYPLRKMVSFALDGITSFSVKPIRLVTLTGFLFSIFSVFAGVYAIISKLMGTAVSGWTSLILSVWFIGGVQLLALGLIGEYIGKIYREVKHRPLYLIEKTLSSRSYVKETDATRAQGEPIYN